jgi:tetratricopeptide (TPR) repeat protein
MRRTVCALFVLTLVGSLASTAHADDRALCANAADDKLDASIAACGRLIKTGKLGAADLSVVFFTRGTRYGTDYYRGNIYGEKGDFDHAIVDYTEAIRLNPAYAEAFFSRGNQHAAKGQTEQFYIDKGEAQRKGRMVAYFDRAVADYDQAVRLKPSDADFYSYRGLAFGMKGDFARAIADYDEAIRLDPKSSNAFEDRGRVEMKKGDIDRSIADFEESLKLDPSNFDSSGDLAQARAALAAKAQAH